MIEYWTALGSSETQLQMNALVALVSAGHVNRQLQQYIQLCLQPVPLPQSGQKNGL